MFLWTCWCVGVRPAPLHAWWCIVRDCMCECVRARVHVRVCMLSPVSIWSLRSLRSLKKVLSDRRDFDRWPVSIWSPRSLGMKKPLNINPKWRLRIKASYLKLVIFSFSLLKLTNSLAKFLSRNGMLFGCFWISSMLQPDFWWISLQSLSSISISCTCFNNLC